MNERTTKSKLNSTNRKFIVNNVSTTLTPKKNYVTAYKRASNISYYFLSQIRQHNSLHLKQITTGNLINTFAAINKQKIPFTSVGIQQSLLPLNNNERQSSWQQSDY